MPLPPDAIHAALKQVDAAWTPARSAEVEARLTVRLDGKRRVRQRVRLLAGVMVTSATVAAATVAAIFVWQPRTPTVVALNESSTAGETGGLRFLDGTTAVATGPSSDLRVVEDTPARQTVRIVKGGARFQVAKAKGRVFRVELRAVVVEVLGTTFRVEEADARVRVSVEEGRVRVQEDGHWAELAAGEVRLFPSSDGAGLPVESSPLDAPSVAGPEGPVGPAVPAGPAPNDEKVRRSPELRGDSAARRAVDRGPGRRDRVGDLMLAADNARLTGHPAAALPYLRAVIERSPRDDRAPVAAFTMGLLLLEQLGRPAEAAQMFSRVVRLDTGAAPLTEDALAREVEAWRQAGKADRARQAAMEYLHRYPDGRRANSVRQLGGIR